MQGDYRLLRQGGGRTAFAHVYVQVMPREVTDHAVIVTIEPGDDDSIAPNQEPELFEAAIQGCFEMLKSLETEGAIKNNYQVAITRLTINLADTRTDAVRTAAYLATASALGIGKFYRPHFEGEWKAVRQNA